MRKFLTVPAVLPFFIAGCGKAPDHAGTIAKVNGDIVAVAPGDEERVGANQPDRCKGRDLKRVSRRCTPRTKARMVSVGERFFAGIVFVMRNLVVLTSRRCAHVLRDGVMMIVVCRILG